MAETKSNQSAAKVLKVLTILLANFAHGVTASELCKATKLSPSNITRYVSTLIEEGYAERIEATGRIRASHKIAQHAVNIMRDLEKAEAQVKESIHRITKSI